MQLGLYDPLLSPTSTDGDDGPAAADSGDSFDSAEDDDASVRDASVTSSGSSAYSPPLPQGFVGAGDSSESPPGPSSPYTAPSTRTLEPEAQAVPLPSQSSGDDLSRREYLAWLFRSGNDHAPPPTEPGLASDASQETPMASSTSLPSLGGTSGQEEDQTVELVPDGTTDAAPPEADSSGLPSRKSEPGPQPVETGAQSSFSPEWQPALPSISSPPAADLREALEALGSTLADVSVTNDRSPEAVQFSNEQALEQNNEELWQQLCASDPPWNQTQENTMAVTANSVKEVLARLELTIEGFIGAAVADSDSGMCLGSVGGAGILNVEVAAAGNTEVVRAKRKAMKALNIRDEIEDMLISLSKQYHLIRPLRSRPVVFIYLAVDRARANLAMARYALAEAERDLGA
jgi:predicted regulator of Ras-like GTPase activity (Roadblock/LC7/MglB family)